jgi:hypothetical protein
MAEPCRALFETAADRPVNVSQLFQGISISKALFWMCLASNNSKSRDMSNQIKTTWLSVRLQITNVLKEAIKSKK